MWNLSEEEALVLYEWTELDLRQDYLIKQNPRLFDISYIKDGKHPQFSPLLFKETFLFFFRKSIKNGTLDSHSFDFRTNEKFSVCELSVHYIWLYLKGQYHAIFSNTLKVEKTLFGIATKI